MSNTTNLNVKIDVQLKKDCEDIFSAIGVSTSAAITMFFKQCVRHGGIPFELKADLPAKKADEK